MERARQFYGSLFGWKQQPPAGASAVGQITKGSRTLAGVTLAPDESASGWTTHFAVASCDTARARIQQAGGSVQGEPADLPAIGRRVEARAPQGA